MFLLDILRQAIQFLLDHWPISVVMLLGTLGIFWLLPRPHPISPIRGTIAATLALVLAGGLLLRAQAVTPETILFYSFSGLAILAGGLLVTQRNPVHAALAFALVVLSTCGLFLLLAAPFLMAATIIVYAGAIVVTFLFVIMLAQQAGPSDADQRSREPLLSSIAGFVLLGALVYLLSLTYDTRAADSLLGRTEQAVNTLDNLIERSQPDARPAPSPGEVKTALDVLNLDDLFKDFSRETDTHRGPSDGSRIDDALRQARATWTDLQTAQERGAGEPPNKLLAELRERLASLQNVGGQFRDTYGNLQPSGDKLLSAFSGPPANQPFHQLPRDARGQVAMPAQNVAALGRSLFTDYLVPVELGGTLLLVATIGAIAISSRRPEGLR